MHDVRCEPKRCAAVCPSTSIRPSWISSLPTVPYHEHALGGLPRAIHVWLAFQPAHPPSFPPKFDLFCALRCDMYIVTVPLRHCSVPCSSRPTLHPTCPMPRSLNDERSTWTIPSLHPHLVCVPCLVYLMFPRSWLCHQCRCSCYPCVRS